MEVELSPYAIGLIRSRSRSNTMSTALLSILAPRRAHTSAATGAAVAIIIRIITVTFVLINPIVDILPGYV